MDNYIIEKKNVFTNEFCHEIIDIYNNYDMENVLNIKQNFCRVNLKKYENIVNILLCINSKLQEQLINMRLNININTEILVFDDYNFLKFEKENGFINYLNDFTVFKNIYSYMEFIIFLNDVEDGGLVEISGNYKIKPEKGKLLIFPSGWIFPYSHKKPLSDDKYIISGKIFSKF